MPAPWARARGIKSYVSSVNPLRFVADGWSGTLGRAAAAAASPASEAVRGFYVADCSDWLIGELCGESDAVEQGLAGHQCDASHLQDPRISSGGSAMPDMNGYGLRDNPWGGGCGAGDVAHTRCVHSDLPVVLRYGRACFPTRLAGTRCESMLRPS